LFLIIFQKMRNAPFLFLTILKKMRNAPYQCAMPRIFFSLSLWLQFRAMWTRRGGTSCSGSTSPATLSASTLCSSGTWSTAVPLCFLNCLAVNCF
jgi:hypothetical protein